MSTTLAVDAALEPRPAGRAPLAAGLGCHILWGLLPILFIWSRSLGAGPLEIVAWRAIWALPCILALVLAAGEAPVLRRLKPITLAALTLSAALILINWSTYVWLVASGQTISASLGYYLSPLLNMAAGAVLFKERISRPALVATGLAAVGVVLQGVALGVFPWVSLVLALSFGGYGIVRKTVAVEARPGLLVECLILFLPAAAYAAWLAHSGSGKFGATPAATLALALGGPATVAALSMFTFATRRLPLSAIGFMQFITPTLQFLVGVETGESMTSLRAVSFVFIWAGALVFALGMWRARPSRMKAGRT